MYNIFMQIIGIDEAGRGPLAGPVSVGACIVPHDFDFSIFKALKDSKQLTELRREEIFKLMQELKSAGNIDFAVALVPHTMIDRKGITYAVRKGISAVLKKLNPEPHSVRVLLDGLLKAPQEFVNQETIIKGDELIPAISLASIAAKVTRDRHMVKLALEYPLYGFDEHKGYGTKKHGELIALHGPCDLHRKTFLKSA
jgi:ribonuclease HII